MEASVVGMACLVRAENGRREIWRMEISWTLCAQEQVDAISRWENFVCAHGPTRDVGGPN